jgi:hypothetical protein
MTILDSILKQWAENRDIEQLISGGLFTDKDAIQSDLDKLADSERKTSLETLQEIQAALTVYIQEMTKEQENIKTQIDANIKSEKACKSYGSSIDIQNKGITDRSRSDDD